MWADLREIMMTTCPHLLLVAHFPEILPVIYARLCNEMIHLDATNSESSAPHSNGAADATSPLRVQDRGIQLLCLV